MKSKNVIRTIEEFSMNAWPATTTLHYDGWVLRFADGYTKRANSVYPLYPSEIAVDEKIAFCESLYQDRDLPAVFKITTSSTPSNLDDRLDARGYCVDSPTSVQLLDFKAGNHELPSGIDLACEDSEAWHIAFARMNKVNPDHQATHEGILRAILPDKCYASIPESDRIIGCGLGVLQSRYLGIFDVVIDPDHRRQGYGEGLMKALLTWGQGNGAHKAYLQVMCNNEPALRLYEKLGFREKYQYWYRIKR
jgi:ribosomal protein S18 acetylase RimI-like enzyme